MKLGVRNDCMVGETLKDKMITLRSLGYDFLELAFSREEIEKLDMEAMRMYKQLVDETGVPICNTSMGELLFFYEKSETEKKAVLDAIRKIIDLTHLVGGSVILLASKENSTQLETYSAVYREGLKEVADYALEKGVTLALEPVGRFRPSVLDALVREINHPAVGLYYDMGNCLYGGEDPVEQAALSGSIIKAIHIKGGMDKELEDMPLQEILNKLKESGFIGRGCLEVGPKDGTNSHIEHALSFLRNLGY